MPIRVVRLLNISLLAPVTALAAVIAASVPVHAQASQPAPYVVCIDPGHGGAPDNNDPSQLFDPGAIGVNGLQEKVATLDIGLRLRTLLQQDAVTVAMTRTTDQYVGIETREATCENAKANLFVSIHLNYFTDPSVNGSLVLYPGEASHPFASTMAETLARDLKPYGVPNTGTQLRDNWWIHATMPTITVEGAYLTSPHDAAWLSTGTGRQQLAAAIRDGIETYDPQALRHKAAVAAWNAEHPAAAPSLPPPPLQLPGGGGGPWVVALLLVAVFGFGWRMRSRLSEVRGAGLRVRRPRPVPVRPLLHAATTLAAAVIALVDRRGTSRRVRHRAPLISSLVLQRPPARRRSRRQLAGRRVTLPSVYDDLPL